MHAQLEPSAARWCFEMVVVVVLRTPPAELSDAAVRPDQRHASIATSSAAPLILRKFKSRPCCGRFCESCRLLLHWLYLPFGSQNGTSAFAAGDGLRQLPRAPACAPCLHRRHPLRGGWHLRRSRRSRGGNRRVATPRASLRASDGHMRPNRGGSQRGYVWIAEC